MRFFNTTGPCNPTDHYMLPATARMEELNIDRLLAEWADAAPSETLGCWRGGPHGICTDSAGNLYVGEVELGVEGRMWKYQRR